MLTLPLFIFKSGGGKEHYYIYHEVVFVRVGSRKEKVIYSHKKKRNPIATDMFRCRVITHAKKRKINK